MGPLGRLPRHPIVAEAPDYGVRNMTDKTNRLSYPYGVMINVEGRRWIDEAFDFQSFTYAKYGGLILKQSKSMVYQIFDSKTMHLLEPRYSTSEPFKSDTLEGLVKQLNVDHAQAMKTLNEYNSACARGGPFNPAVLDGLCTEGISPPEEQLGAKARSAAVRVLGGDWRHHLHFWRHQGHPGRAGRLDRLENHGWSLCLR